MSHISSFQSLMDGIEATNNFPNTMIEEPAASHASEEALPPLVFQDIDEWEREQDALAASRPKLEVLHQQTKMRNVIEPAVKKQKVNKAVDEKVIIAEKLALEEMGSGNWVGKLQMFRDTRPISGGGIDYVEGYTMNPIPRFTYTVAIAESPMVFGPNTAAFGEESISFSNKKSAKQYAAKKAVDWLTAHNYLLDDNSVPHKAIPSPKPKAPKVVASQSQVKQITASTEPTLSPLQNLTPVTTYAQQVPGLCNRLGFNVPTYKLESTSPGSSMYNAYADFGADLRIDGKVGEVKNVFGRKRAKEAVAEIVISFLKGIEQHRYAHAGLESGKDDDDKKRKRSTDLQ